MPTKVTHSLARVTLFLFGTGVGCGWAQSNSSSGESSYSTDELVAAVISQLTSIVSLDCEFTVQFPGGSTSKRHRYACSGDKWHYTELYRDAQGRDTSNTTCSNGEINYSFVVHGERDDATHWSSVQTHDACPQQNLHPGCMLGDALINVACDLTEALESVRIDKAAVVTLPGGTPGVQLLARGVPTTRPDAIGRKYDVAVTVSLAHDFLPQEIMVTAPGKTRIKHVWKILDYRRVLNEHNDQEQWFPVLGVLEQGETGDHKIRMEVDEVRINPPLPSTLFDPEIPDGVTIADRTAAGHGQVTVKGGHPGMDRLASDITKKARMAQSKSWMRWALVWSSVLLAVVAALIWGFRARFQSTGS